MKYQWQNENREKAVNSWLDLKYGMFIHFGLFSLCGGVWDKQIVNYGYSEQILAHGPVPQADYEKLTESFKVEHFDADSIARLAKESGMSYIVMTSKHHDGFCLFDTETTSYNSVNAACHRDLIGEMSQACRKNGLKFGVYYSWIDWHFPYAMPISPHNSDVIPPSHMKYNLEQLSELLSKYGQICELWMDMGAPTVEQSREVAELAHRLQPEIMINGRVWNDYGDFVTMADNGYPDCELDIPWQTPATVYRETWGYRSWQKREDPEGKIRVLSDNILRVIEGGGNFLLNIGPADDGSVVPFEMQVLLGIGKEIEKKGGLIRHKASSPENSIPIEEAPVILKDGVPGFRFTGAEYYSLKKIITSYNWSIKPEESGSYRVSYMLDAPLVNENKLCLDIGDETFIFSLKQKKKDFIISSSVFLKEGISTVSLYTPGSTLSRPEFPKLNIKIRIEKR